MCASKLTLQDHSKLGTGKLQYEGQRVLCFKCGRYGHRSLHCPALKEHSKEANTETTNKTLVRDEHTQNKPKDGTTKEMSSGFGPWMVATKTRHQPAKPYKAANGEGGGAGSDNQSRRKIQWNSWHNSQ